MTSDSPCKNPFEEESTSKWRASLRSQAHSDVYEQNCVVENVVQRPVSSMSRSSCSSPLASFAGYTRSASAGSRVFDFYDATVNLPAILNDPRKPRPTDFLTRTWGEQFIEQSVKASPLLEQLSMEDFRPYVRTVNVRQALHKGTQSCDRGRKATLSADLSNIPTVFFATEFSLENAATFKQICPPCAFSDRDAQRAIKSQQEKTAQYLDVVESEIARNVSVRTESFFSVVGNHDLLQERMDTSLGKVVALRGALRNIQDVAVKPAINTLLILQRKWNMERMLEKMQTVSTISQTQATIQMLLSNGDFVGALDVITTTKEVLSTELCGLLCFKHLPHQLLEMEKFIDKMMSLEFRRALSAHLNRPLDIDTESQKMLDEERFSAIITGLIRQRRFNVVDWFREEALSALQATLKFVLISSLSSQAADSEEEADDGEETLPYHLLRALDFRGLLQLLEDFRNPLKEILVRIRAAHDVVGNLEWWRLSDDSRTGISVDLGFSSTDFSRLATQLQELLFAVSEEMQEEMNKILNKTPGWKELRHHNDDLLCLYHMLHTILYNAESVLGIRMSMLNAQLQKLAFAFVGRFHDDRKQKLTLILDSDRWTPAQIPLEIQSFLNNVVVEKTFLVALPRQKSEESVDQTDDPSKLSGPSASGVVSHLSINNQTFVVVGTVVLLLRMLGQYAALLKKLPSSVNISGDLLQKIVELLKSFNSRTCQLVLGAGAIQSAGLRAITSRNLSLASRCLELVVLFVPILRDDLAAHLPAKQSHLLKNFDSLLRDFEAHIEEIDKKLVQIFDTQLINILARWEGKVPVPSVSFKQVAGYIRRLYEAIQDILPRDHLERFFTSIFTLFKRRLKQQISKLAVSSDDGPRRGIINSDISFLCDEIRALAKLSFFQENSFDEVWER